MSDLLLALAERCEQSEGPCRDLDAAIAVAASGDEKAWVVEAKAGSMFSHKPGWWRDSDDKSHSAFEYTASLDAALLLIPDEYDWIIGNVNGRHGGTPYACVGSIEEVFADTPVLALCAAALRARKRHASA